MQLTASSLIQHCLHHRNNQVNGNLHLVRPIATHYALQSGHDRDDLLQVGYLGLIKASNRFKAENGATFPSFARPHIRGAILHYLRDGVGLIRLPRSVEERAMQLMRSSELCVNAQDALTIQHYRGKNRWVEFNDDVVDDDDAGMTLVERSEVWNQISSIFRQIGKDEQFALQKVVIEGMSLRQTAQKLGVSAMTVQRRVKRGLQSIANGLQSVQDGA